MRNLAILILAIILTSCRTESNHPAIGTWKLLYGEITTGKDTTFSDYTLNEECIKIISPTHFSFMRHDLKNGHDSTKILFVSGGGKCELKDSLYTEHLDFCNYRDWEGGKFELTIKVSGDTLTQTGIEKIETLGINRVNAETYARMK